METSELLDQLDALHDEMMNALAHNHSRRVQALVLQQCQIAVALQNRSLSDEHIRRLQLIRDLVNQEQALVAQALQVADFFLTKLHEQSNFLEFG